MTPTEEHYEWLLATANRDCEKYNGMHQIAVLEIDRLRDALERVLADVAEHEKANNLAPNPGRRYCWDSVDHAKNVLARVSEDHEGAKCSGSTSVSKTERGGSIPPASANLEELLADICMELDCDPDNEAILASISRLQADLIRTRRDGNLFADYLEREYCSLPADMHPGPPTMLVANMRRAFREAK